MTRISVPRPVTVKTRFFGRYTAADMVRIGAPTLLGMLVAGPIGVTAAVLGISLAEYRYDGRPLDKVAWDAVQQRLGLAMGTWTAASTDEQRVITTDNGTVAGIVRVSSVDLEMLSDAEVAAQLDTVNDLFTAIDYPVKLYSRQHRKDMDGFAGATGETVVTNHYAVVPVSPNEADSDEALVELVDDRCREVMDELTAGDMYAERVTGDDLQNAVQGVVEQPDEIDATRYSVNSEHRQILYVDEYPTEVSPGWLATALDVEAPGLVDIVQTVEPIVDEDRGRLKVERVKASVEGAMTTDPFREWEMTQLQEDINDLVEVEMEGEPLLHYGVYIVVRGETSEEVEATGDAVTSVLGQIETGVPRFKMNKAVRTVSPVFPDELGVTRIVPGTTAASGFPWAASDTVDDTGVVVGAEKDGTPVVLDRFSWDAPNIVVTGKNGSGKSYWMSLLMLRSVEAYDDLDVWVIDPKQRDYGDVVEALDGETVVLDEVDVSSLPSTGGVVRFTVADPSRDNTDMLVDAVRHIYREASKDASPSLVVIDELHRVITDRTSVHPDGLRAVSELVREGRDRNIGVTVATQNADEFTRVGEGKNLLRNVDCYVFFKQQDVETEVEEFFRLSRREAVDLRKLRTGKDTGFSEAIVRGPVNTTLRVEATEREAAVIEGRSLKNEEDDGAAVEAPLPVPIEDTSPVPVEDTSPVAASRDEPDTASDSDDDSGVDWFYFVIVGLVVDILLTGVGAPRLSIALVTVFSLLVLFGGLSYDWWTDQVEDEEDDVSESSATLIDTSHDGSDDDGDSGSEPMIASYQAFAGLSVMSLIAGIVNGITVPIATWIGATAAGCSLIFAVALFLWRQRGV